MQKYAQIISKHIFPAAFRERKGNEALIFRQKLHIIFNRFNTNQINEEKINTILLERK